MKILIVSGFLGAGKTTFIKQMIRKTGKYLVILENEYGQNNLDSQQISRSGPADLKLLQFMEGCVCCTKKDTFSNTILTISAGIDPDYLVVEPTGVGKLSNILAAIGKVTYDKIRVLRPVVVLAPQTYDANMHQFGDIYQDQLAYAGTVVLSKIEHEDPQLIAAVSEKIRCINPTAQIITQHYSSLDADWYNHLWLEEGETTVEPVADAAQEDPDMMQVSLKNAALTRPAELIILLQDLLRGEFGLVARAKGVLQVGQEWLRFDLADRAYAIISEDTESPVTQCVFIGRELNKQKLCDRLGSFETILGTSPAQRRLNQRSRDRSLFN